MERFYFFNKRKRKEHASFNIFFFVFYFFSFSHKEVDGKDINTIYARQLEKQAFYERETTKNMYIKKGIIIIITVLSTRI